MTNNADFFADIPSFHGLAIREDSTMTEGKWRQLRFPRSRKVRVRKKWRRQRKNWGVVIVPMTTVYRIGDTLIMHPTMVNKLRREIDRKNEKDAR